MRWIALKMLVGDRAKFYGIVLGLTFAALLITQQGSIFWGLMLRTSSQIIDISGADLWVMDKNVRFIDDVKPMLENQLYRVRGVPGVLWAVPLYKGQGRAKLTTIDPDGTPNDVIEQVILLGLDDASMVGAPREILIGKLSDLRKPDAIIVDKVGLRKLYPGQGGETAKTPEELRKFLGREIEMNDHRAVIVGICEATRTFQSFPVVYTTYSRAKQFTPQERKVLTYVLAKAEPGLAPLEVARRITERTQLQARSSEEFKGMTIAYYMKYTGIPVNFGITALLGFLVGTAIAGQTFYNFTLENLKQFGALKAMGTTNGRIVRMILLQATVVGLLGYGMGVGLATLFGLSTQGTELAFNTPWILLPITGAAIVLICLLSSVLSIRRVIVLEPAVVFRG
ncbi:MAG TPA: ABC transporter permease [Isosphaeraceae bacterium]|jgi:putative ABC transport system permease protein|nr:ABC transporter permease [Isosphaeraceae bacterium]